MKCSSGVFVNMQARSAIVGAAAVGEVALGELAQQRLVLGIDLAAHGVGRPSSRRGGGSGRT